MKREKKNIKTVEKRMKEFKKDLSKWKEYDYVVINSNLNACYKNIMLAIKAKQKFHLIEFYKKHVKKLLVKFS